jgi:glycosyltransferase involved in cell wall biosynthesis
MQVMVNTCKQLAVMGHDVTILDRKYSKNDPDTEKWEGISIVRFGVPQIRPRHVPGFVDFLFAELNAVTFTLCVSRYLRRNRHNLDVVHVHYSSIGLILAMLNRGLRSTMVYTCHLSHWALDPSQLSRIERIEIATDACLMRRAGLTIALNESARESFITRGKVKAESVTVLPNGVDTMFFSPSVDTAPVADRYGLAGRPIVLFVGRLARIKGLEDLLKAADVVVNRHGHKDVLFILVGSPEYDAVDRSLVGTELRHSIDSLGLERNVLMTGSLPLDDVRRLYAASDVFVLPSLAEGDPLVTLEAMASGLPVIATKVGGIPRQIEDGHNGYLVDVGDHGQLADKIRYLLGRPEERKRLSLNARKSAEASFSWASSAERLAGQYVALGEGARQ